MIFDDIKKSITSNYEKGLESNIGKFIKVFSDELEEIKTTLITVEEWENLDNAEGEVLDLYGKNVLQFRGQATDEVYRALIRSKVSRDRSTADYNTLIEILSALVGVPYEQIRIENGTHPLYQTVSIIELPIEALNNLGLTANQFGRILAKIIAGGIGLESAVFAGTFVFVDVLSTGVDGYGDVGMTTGGTLGAVYQPENDPDLPI